MKQYHVLQYGYLQLLQLLEERGTETHLFTVSDGNPQSYATGNKLKETDIIVHTSITDVCQIQQDKNGQRIIVDEIMYEMPTVILCHIALHICATHYAQALKATGSIITCLKDNSTIALNEYTWHGSSTEKLYIEPLIRSSSAAHTKYMPAGYEGASVIQLDYRMEAGINSEKGSQFKRVEKREIRGEIMK